MKGREEPTVEAICDETSALLTNINRVRFNGTSHMLNIMIKDLQAIKASDKNFTSHIDSINLRMDFQLDPDFSNDEKKLVSTAVAYLQVLVPLRSITQQMINAEDGVFKKNNFSLESEADNLKQKLLLLSPAIEEKHRVSQTLYIEEDKNIQSVNDILLGPKKPKPQKLTKAEYIEGMKKSVQEGNRKLTLNPIVEPNKPKPTSMTQSARYRLFKENKKENAQSQLKIEEAKLKVMKPRGGQG
jgi:hypothetical protein